MQIFLKDIFKHEGSSDHVLGDHFKLLLIVITRKCQLRRHILAPPEGLRGLGLPGVDPGGQPQESKGDSKVI